MNEFKFYGAVNQAPELVESEKGNKYCNILLNVKRNFTNADGDKLSDDFKITCFRQTAEDACKKLKKGTKLIVKGRIQQNNYSKDENKVFYTPELIGEKLEILD